MLQDLPDPMPGYHPPAHAPARPSRTLAALRRGPGQALARPGTGQAPPRHWPGPTRPKPSIVQAFVRSAQVLGHCLGRFDTDSANLIDQKTFLLRFVPVCLGSARFAHRSESLVSQSFAPHVRQLTQLSTHRSQKVSICEHTHYTCSCGP